MKSIFTCLFLCVLAFSGCRSSKPVADSRATNANSDTQTDSYHKFADQATWVLGYFTRQQINTPPHSEWFQKGYDEYLFNQDVVNKLTQIQKDGLSIKIVMGTWCPDSRREVPRFMRIIDSWQFPAEKITFIGVDNSKLSPVGEYESLGIQRVPTFIFYKNNIEAGRIIEVPVTSLEQDIVNILNKE